ncbi:hypothetical protein Dimus_028745, partial [Dionaea muscipula]
TSLDPDEAFEDRYMGEGNLISTAQREALDIDFNVADVKEALWSIGDDKAPGIDGFNAFSSRDRGGSLDDLMVVSRADPRSLLLLRERISHFGRISGLEANLNKSVIYFGGVGDDRKNELCYRLKMSQAISSKD